MTIVRVTTLPDNSRSAVPRISVSATVTAEKVVAPMAIGLDNPGPALACDLKRISTSPNDWQVALRAANLSATGITSFGTRTLSAKVSPR